MAAGNFFVLTEEVAYLSAAYAYIACGYVGVGAYNLVKLCHKALAKSHYFVVALTLGVKIRTALAAAYGKTGKRVFENLLKAEEFNYAHIDRRVEAKAALVRTYRAVKLNTVAAVYVNRAVVVNPRNSEYGCLFRCHKPLKKSRFLILWISLNGRLYGFKNLGDSLAKFGLIVVPCRCAVKHFVNIAHF